MFSATIWSTISNFKTTNAQTQYTISWSGYTWNLKASTDYGPGPNAWSPHNVYVDGNGDLNLIINQTGTTWYCGEADCQTSLSYGTYTWTTIGKLTYDPNVVLGMFCYYNDSNEIDIEYSQWANPSSGNNADFVVQDYPFSATYFNIATTSTILLNSFTWKPSGETFSISTYNGTLLKTWQSASIVPNTQYMTPDINLWLYQGVSPAPGTYHATIANFTYTPSSIVTPTATPTAAPTPTPTIEPTSTPTPTTTPTPTLAPSPPPTATPKPTSTPTPTPTPTPSPTATPSPTPSPTPTLTPTPRPSPTPNPTPTKTPTPSPSPTPTPTPSHRKHGHITN